jgi:hypothetical protein
MPEKPYTARNWKRGCSGLAAAVLLFAGAAGAYDGDTTVDSGAWLDGYGLGDPYRSPGPDYGALGLVDPGYAFSPYDVYGYTGYGVRDYGGGGYGYSGHGFSDYPYPGYGSVTRRYYSPAYAGAPDATAAADRRYIRRLEERIRKLENANQQSQPAFGERLTSPVSPSFNAVLPAYEAPAAGQPGKSSYPGTGSPQGGYSEYPTFQPSYGGQPTYRFGQ